MLNDYKMKALIEDRTISEYIVMLYTSHKTCKIEWKRMMSLNENCLNVINLVATLLPMTLKQLNTETFYVKLKRF